MSVVGLQRWFPLWALLSSAFAYARPEPFAAAGDAIVLLLGLVMFGMGMTLSGRDFMAVVSRPGVVVLGVSLQFLVMPLIGWLLASTAGLAGGLVAGVVLLGSCPGGTASNVMCYLARGDVALSIEDTGVGIAEEDREQIFERFRQVDGSDARQAGGLGLGLAITRPLVTLLGGKLEIESELNRGSTFTVCLPACPALNQDD